ncbi:MAG TPA: ROK family protein [Polyangiaceae bacterium]|nr:ROK family protein [Polyangiaceae bacterium]
MRIGVDLGGSKIEIIAIDAQGAEIQRRRVPTPHADYQAIVKTITDLVADVEAAIGEQASVGIGTPGALSSHTGLLKNSNTTCLNGKPLLQDLQTALGRPIQLANDANCFALSEAVDGAGRDANVVFGVILGTGVGGGVVVQRRAWSGVNSIAGEWGHNALPWPQANELPGPECYCGRQGCIETFLSGPGLARELSEHTGLALSASEIAERAERGDASCDEALRRYESRLARGLASVINLLDPDLIVLGGGLSNVARLYRNVPELWGQWVFSDTVRTRLSRAVHGDSSGVRGAAWLWSDDTP